MHILLVVFAIIVIVVMVARLGFISVDSTPALSPAPDSDALFPKVSVKAALEGFEFKDFTGEFAKGDDKYELRVVFTAPDEILDIDYLLPHPNLPSVEVEVIRMADNRMISRLSYFPLFTSYSVLRCGFTDDARLPKSELDQWVNVVTDEAMQQVAAYAKLQGFDFKPR